MELPKNSSAGFSLLESMIALSVAGAIVAVAAESLESNQRSSAYAQTVHSRNDLINALAGYGTSINSLLTSAQMGQTWISSAAWVYRRACRPTGLVIPSSPIR